jgi:hypothetical protein
LERVIAEVHAKYDRPSPKVNDDQAGEAAGGPR